MPKQHYRPESFQLRDSIGYLIKRAQRLAQERIETVFDEQGCTLQQWVVLMHVRDNIAVTIADMCRELHHDSGAMTRLIDQLEARKLIERRRNAEDRRVIELSLTRTGEKMVDKLIPIACDTLNVALDGFTREEVRTLQTLLRRMIGGLEKSLQPSDASVTGAKENAS